MFDTGWKALLTKQKAYSGQPPRLPTRVGASGEVICIQTQGRSLDELLEKEWLLTNSRGSYCSSTTICCNTRRYHGLLVGSLNPPANRIMGLSCVLEMVIIADRMFNLSTFEFNEKFSPAGFEYVKRFRRDVGAHFDYQLDDIELTKSVYLARDSDTVLIEYDFRNLERSIEFILRPFVGLRDFHSLQKSYAPLCSAQLGQELFICHDTPGSCELLLSCPDMQFEKDPQWWFNFVYRQDKQRGQDFVEDLWAPGFYKCQIDPRGGKIILKANLSNNCKTECLAEVDMQQVTRELASHQQIVVAGAKTKDHVMRILALAADQFVCRAQANPASRATVLAGYPWFFDWGRDAFIALPGLLLATGKFDAARSVLTTFAAAADEGMIPNRFDDRSGTAYFNSVDASLWFINAAFQYLKTTGDGTTFSQQLLGVISHIIESYQRGTRFGIHVDSDGLVAGGNAETQLTWMDAKHGGTAFTPRHGKAVEVNALWYNALSLLAEFYATWDIKQAAQFDAMADRVKESFREKFWNKQTGYLNDCIAPDGTADTSCRPNQIFAVSLEFSPLSSQQQRQIVEVVRERLLTPFGLRSLDPADARYRAAYAGSPRQRDESYHQGTVWAYLIGPFVEAYLKVNDYSSQSKQQAAEFIEPLIRHLTEDACLGSISEIFDGDTPHKPRGCFAQAWSAAELIRALRLINS